MKQPTVMSKPRLALQIGIAGHRANKLDPESRAAVDHALRTLYAMIGEAIGKIALETQDRTYATAAPLIRIVSGLAEGADRIAITASPADWRLEAILPMPRSEYARDFLVNAAASESNTEFERLLARAASVTELPLLPGIDVRDDAGRAQHYHALAAFLVRQIDLLVAVWDGQQADGPGGTGAVVARACNEGRPVLWIDPKHAETSRRLLALDAAAHTDHRCQPLNAGAVDRLLRDILMPPAPPVSAHGDHHGAHGNENGAGEHAATAKTIAQLPSYFALRWPKPMHWPFAYNLLRWLAGAGRWSWPIAYPSYDDLAKSWDGFFAAIAGRPSRNAAEFNGRVRSILLPRSIWADALAWYYGHLYRSAYVSIFILAGLSVPVGLCYLFFLESPAVLDIKAGFVFVELAIIGTVVVVVQLGVRRHWHAVWLATRELSELLRLGRSLAYVGALRDFVAAPQALGRETIPSWYVRATFREIGLPSGVLDANYLRHVLNAALTTEIEEQRAYHTANTRNLEKIHHMLHHKGDACFVATAGILVIYLLAWIIDRFLLPGAAHAQEHAAAHPHGPFHEFLEYVLKPIVSIAAAGLPAFGAALSGIRAQGDFEGFAQRSATTHHELTEVEHQIGALLAVPDQIDLQAATDVLLAATRVMAKDVSAWQQLYVSKRLTLPA
jgi:hypothetical protein